MSYWARFKKDYQEFIHREREAAAPVTEHPYLSIISPFVAATYCFGSGEDQFPTLSVTCDGLPSCGDPAHPFWLSVRKRSLVR